jgi:hypothetical protein
MIENIKPINERIENLIKWFASVNYNTLFHNRNEKHNSNETFLIKVNNLYRNYVKINYNLSHKWLYIAIFFDERTFIRIKGKHYNSVELLFKELKDFCISYQRTTFNEIAKSNSQRDFNFIWYNIPLDNYESYLE